MSTTSRSSCVAAAITSSAWRLSFDAVRRRSIARKEAPNPATTTSTATAAARMICVASGTGRRSIASTLPSMAVVIASQLRKELSGSILFDGVSFKVERRDRVALAGPNGAGKTTLLRVLAGESELHGGE